MFRKNKRIAELEAELDVLMRVDRCLVQENDLLKTRIVALKTEILKLNNLVNNFKSKDTEIFVYNGDIYKITELQHTKKPTELDTLNLELVNVGVSNE